MSDAIERTGNGQSHLNAANDSGRMTSKPEVGLSSDSECEQAITQAIPQPWTSAWITCAMAIYQQISARYRSLQRCLRELLWRDAPWCNPARRRHECFIYSDY
jgi:hypothetical protein